MAPQRPLKVVVMITALGRVEKLMEVLRQFVSDSVCELSCSTKKKQRIPKDKCYCVNLAVSIRQINGAQSVNRQ